MIEIAPSGTNQDSPENDEIALGKVADSVKHLGRVCDAAASNTSSDEQLEHDSRWQESDA